MKNVRYSDFLCRQKVGVDGHAGYGVYVDCGEGVDFGLGADAAGYDELVLGEVAETLGDFYGEALHEAFAVDVGVEVGAYVGFESLDGLIGSEIDLGFPAFDGDFAGTGVDAGDYALRAYGGG